MKNLMRSAAIALLAVAVCVPTAGAETTKCQRTIGKANSQFLQARVKALAKCEEGIVKSGGLPGSCPDAKATSSIDKAASKMAASIGKSCGGADKVCGGDTTGEDTPASLGWPNLCPNFEKGNCINTISDCGGIATCLTCIGGSASDQAMSLYYGDLVPATTADKALNKCQISIGKATSAFLNSSSKALQKCWDAKANGKHTGECFAPSAGDGKYAAAIQKAEDKKQATICKACGGADKACGGGDDFTPAQIGFAATCPAVTRPNGGQACGAIATTTLQGIVDCVDCVTSFKADCDDLLSVPQYESPYPPECNVCTAPAPSGACPATISFTADGTTVDLDTGFTGLAHDATVPTNGRITLAVSGCAGGSQPTCGQCNVSGPLDNAGGVEFNNHRCKDASWVQCSVDADCTSATQCIGGANTGASCTVASQCPGGACSNAGILGPCIYFFGAPLPLRAGGVSTCILNQISGPITGTINIDDGTTTTNVPLSSRVHPIGTEFAPCPHCTAGQCQDGPRLNQACTVNGTGIFGDVSLDCPPNPGSLAGALGINLAIATSVQTKTVEAGNPTCRQTGYSGAKCLCDTCNNLNQEGCSLNADCPANGGGAGICGGRRCIGGTEAGQPCGTCIGGANHGASCNTDSVCPAGTCANPRVCSGGSNDGASCGNDTACPGGACVNCEGGGVCNRPGEPTQPNACLDDTTTVPQEGCVSAGGDEGECEAGPTDSVCSIQTFRSCGTATDCEPSVTCPECLAGQSCITRLRPCFTDNGVIGNSLSVQGNPDVPCGGISRPTVGTFFCVAPVGATAVNAAGGLPAVGRIRIPGVVLIDP